MPEAVTVRRYRASDLPQVLWLHDRTPPWGGIASAPQPRTEEVEHLEEHFAAVWVAVEPAEDGECVVGLTAMKDVGQDAIPPVAVADFVDTSQRLARLRLMRVAPERWRRGIGALLAQEAIAWARADGYDAVILDTTVQQDGARALYESAGFAEVGRSMLGRYELVWFELVLYPRLLP